VGASRRAFLKEAKAAYPTRVIVGSGDLCDELDVLAMLRETGIDGARVARGGIGAPWVSTVLSPPTSRPSCGASATSTSPKTTSVRSGTVRSRATSLPPAPAAADGHLTAAMDGDGDDA
jgi:tRNA-dihydrouridine synthase